MESTAPAAGAPRQVRYKAGVWNISSVPQSAAPSLTSRLGFFWTKVAPCFLREVKLLFVMIPCQGLLSIRSHNRIAGKLTGDTGVSARGGNPCWCTHRCGRVARRSPALPRSPSKPTRPSHSYMGEQSPRLSPQGGNTHLARKAPVWWRPLTENPPLKSRFQATKIKNTKKLLLSPSPPGSPGTCWTKPGQLLWGEGCRELGDGEQGPHPVVAPSDRQWGPPRLLSLARPERISPFNKLSGKPQPHATQSLETTKLVPNGIWGTCASLLFQQPALGSWQEPPLLALPLRWTIFFSPEGGRTSGQEEALRSATLYK